MILRFVKHILTFYQNFEQKKTKSGQQIEVTSKVSGHYAQLKVSTDLLAQGIQVGY